MSSVPQRRQEQPMHDSIHIFGIRHPSWMEHGKWSGAQDEIPRLRRKMRRRNKEIRQRRALIIRGYDGATYLKSALCRSANDPRQEKRNLRSDHRSTRSRRKRRLEGDESAPGHVLSSLYRRHLEPQTCNVRKLPQASAAQGGVRSGEGIRTDPSCTYHRGAMFRLFAAGISNVG